MQVAEVVVIMLVVVMGLVLAVEIEVLVPGGGWASFAAGANGKLLDLQLRRIL